LEQDFAAKNLSQDSRERASRKVSLSFRLLLIASVTPSFGFEAPLQKLCFFISAWVSECDIFLTMADDRWRAARPARGKSEHQTAACRAKGAGAGLARESRRKVSQKTYSLLSARAFAGQRWKGEVRAHRSARKHRGRKNPMRCKTKQRKGSRSA